MNKRSDDFMEVRNPKMLGVDRIPVERIPIGTTGDVKPVVAKCPNGDLLVSAYRLAPAGTEPVKRHPEIKKRVLTSPILFRSRDGGRTWSPPHLPDIAGTEPYVSVTSDGTIFITTHVLWQNILNREEPLYCYGMLHRSDDGGKNWTSIRAEPDIIRTEQRGYYNVTTRFPLELSDGSLLFVASGTGIDANTMLRSTDGGKTWSERYPSVVEGVPADYPFPFMAEGVLWQARSGKIMAIFRVDTRHWPEIEKDPLSADREMDDSYDRMMLYSTIDLGHTWKQVDDFGSYCQMYPSILRLQDGRLLLTFTQREPYDEQPSGLRAVVGTELDDGFEFDFRKDLIMIDTKTPGTLPNGGGFGCTVQLDDGMLVSVYSYRTHEHEFAGDRQLYCEIVRWRLP